MWRSLADIMRRILRIRRHKLEFLDQRAVPDAGATRREIELHRPPHLPRWFIDPPTFRFDLLAALAFANQYGLVTDRLPAIVDDWHPSRIVWGWRVARMWRPHQPHANTRGVCKRPAVSAGR